MGIHNFDGYFQIVLHGGYFNLHHIINIHIHTATLFPLHPCQHNAVANFFDLCQSER